MIEENSHYMDEAQRRSAGEYDFVFQAIEAAKRVVDRSLEEIAGEGRTAAEMFEAYCQFGDDAFITGFDGDLHFSAREYARDRCNDLAGAGWLDLSRAGRFAEGEPAMLRATAAPEGYFPLNEVRASFYENWGDRLDGAEKRAKYEEALLNWQMFASCATSGGEGTARMMDVHRVEKKLAKLVGDKR